MERKIRKDAKCHYCGRFLAESATPIRNGIRCECGWEPTPHKYPHGSTYSDAGRPRYEPPFDPYDVSLRDQEAPAWFQEAMLFHEKWLTVQQFAVLYGTHPTQVRRWCNLGFIHYAWTDHTYYKPKREITGNPDIDDKPRKKTNIKWRHYCFHLKEGQKAHRRIPVTEVERCQFLKIRQRGCGRDPRFIGSDANGTRRIAPPLVPESPHWHLLKYVPVMISEPANVSRPVLGSEPIDIRKPLKVSEPEDASIPKKVSEPSGVSKPSVQSEPIQKSETTVQSDDIDLSVFEE